jgi:type I restriction enzyme, S subunit
MGASRVRVRLGEVVDLLTGFPFKSALYTSDAAAPRLLRGDNIVQGALRWESAKRWPTHLVGEVEQYALRDGDVVLAMDRPWIEAGLKYSSVDLHDLPCLLVQRVARLRARQPLDQGYLKYIIGSAAFTDHVLAVQTGTAVPHISGDQIRSFAFELPSLSEQHAVVEILGALDDKIDLNRRTNETLESIVRALFKSWFVDLDGVAAQDRIQTPDGLTIPRGWALRTIGDVAEFAYGKALKEEERRPGEVPVFGSNGQVGWHDTALAKGPGIIIGRKGNPGVVTWAPTDFFAIDTTFFVQPRIPLGLPFLHQSLKLQHLPSLAADSAVPGLNRQIAYMNKILVPPRRLTHSFDDAVAPLYARTFSNERENRTLAALRDALLPRLLSGEVRIRDAEREVAAVV